MEVKDVNVKLSSHDTSTEAHAGDKPYTPLPIIGSAAYGHKRMTDSFTKASSVPLPNVEALWTE